MLSIFSNFSSTNEDNKNAIRPIKVNLSPNRAFEQISKYVEESPLYSCQRYNKDFLEIYYVEDAYEVTLIISPNENGSSQINITVYGEKKHGLTKRKLKKVVNQFTTLLVN